MFTEYLLCSKYCFRSGDTAVNETDYNLYCHRNKYSGREGSKFVVYLEVIKQSGIGNLADICRNIIPDTINKLKNSNMKGIWSVQ